MPEHIITQITNTILASMGEILQHLRIMPRTPFNVLFVCLGNICRSPAGENIFRHHVSKAGLEDVIHIDSAGTHNYHPSKSPDSRMSRTLIGRNIPVTGKARQFNTKDYDRFDLILTMDVDNFAEIISLANHSEEKAKVKPFTTFCQDPENQIADVPDPYYGEHSGFERVADILDDGCRQLLVHVQKQLD